MSNQEPRDPRFASLAMQHRLSRRTLMRGSTLAVGGLALSGLLAACGDDDDPTATPEWGAKVSTARQYLSTSPHTFFFPTIVIFITVVAFNLLGDALRDTLDPTMRD